MMVFRLLLHIVNDVRRGFATRILSLLSAVFGSRTPAGPEHGIVVSHRFGASATAGHRMRVLSIPRIESPERGPE